MFLWVAKALADRGFDVTILTYKKNLSDDVPSNVKWIQMNLEHSSFLKSVFTLRRCIKELKPECVISFLLDANVLNTLACLGLKTKSVICERSDPFKPGYYKLKILRHLFRLAKGGVFQLPKVYLETLRKLEYHKNNCGSLIHKIFYGICFLMYRRMCNKTGMYIFPKTVDLGLLLPHLGFIRVNSFVKIGKNCTILPMVLFGKKSPGLQGTRIVGDNRYVSTGATILGPVTIGNNVTIGAGAVVTKDVPDNAVVVGGPAKIIKIKEPK